MASIKLEVRFTKSQSTDFSDRDWATNWDDYSATPSDAMNIEIVPATGAGTTIDTGHITAMGHVAVYNADAAISVSATYSTAATAGVVSDIAAGKFLVIPDFDITGDLKLVAASGSPQVQVVIEGT